MKDNKILNAMKSCSEAIDNAMSVFLPKDDSSKIIESMRYSSLGGGKKIRPFLLTICADVFDVPFERCVDMACAIEFSHVFSLIHDDLPAMDDDDYRRGKLSNHKQFDEATAILAGDALLPLAFEIIATSSLCNAETRCELVALLANGIGYQGMIGGQMIDIENVGKKINLDQMLNLHYLKTGRLFEICAEAGAILGEASKNERKAIKEYAKKLGLVFQITDDVIDYIENDSNEPIYETSIVSLLGLEGAKVFLEKLKVEIAESLKLFGNKAQNLEDLLYFVINRNN